MVNQFRRLVESILYAGLKPAGAPKRPAKAVRWLGPLPRLFERMVSGSAPTDPLYLTNRSPAQRIRQWALIVVPCLVLGGVLTLTLTNYFRPRDPAPTPATAIELARRLLPNLGSLKVESNKDIEILDAHVDRSAGVRLVGTVKNIAGREIDGAELGFDLADPDGSQVGAISVKVGRLAANATASFSTTLEPSTVQFVLVREVRSR